jgi:hypothetical protein
MILLNRKSGKTWEETVNRKREGERAERKIDKRKGKTRKVSDGKVLRISCLLILYDSLRNIINHQFQNEYPFASLQSLHLLI